MKIKLITVLAFFSILISCKSQKENVENKVEETVEVDKKMEPKFNIGEFKGYYEFTFIKDGIELNEIKPTIFFDGDGEMKGHNGCNSFFGSVNPSNDAVFGDIGTTRMACEGEQSEVESMIMQKLQEITNIENLPPDEINFYAGEEVVLKARRIKLEGSFKVNMLKSKSLEKSTITFSISENELHGNTGCNSFTGAWKQQGYDLDLKGIAATEMACENFDMKTEAEFLAALSIASRYEVNEDQVNFYQGNTLVFSAIGN